MNILRPLLILMLVSLGACPQSETPTPGSDVETHSDGKADGQDAADSDLPDGPPRVVFPNEWTAEADPESGAWSLLDPAGKTVLQGGRRGSDSIALGRGEPEVVMEFGSFQIDLDAMTWGGLPQAAPTRIDVEAGRGLNMRWDLTGGASVVLSLTAYGPQGQLERDVRVGLSINGASDVTAAALVIESPAEQDFFGLGAQVFGMSLRGGKFPLWTTEQGIGKPDDYTFFPLSNIREASYAPMGIWHASAGGELAAHSAVVGHDGFTELDLAETLSDAVVIRSYRELPSFVVVAGDDARARVTAISDYVGKPPAPQPWVFGPWNDAVGGPEKLSQVAAKLRDNDIPSSALWAEDWIGGQELASGYRLSYSWEWDTELYPDLPGNITSLHADGFAFLAYFNTFVPNTVNRFADGDSSGYLVKKADGATYLLTDPAGRQSGLVDLTNDAAKAWFEGFMRTCAETLGADGWMADFTEWMPHDASLASGESGWEYHNRYPLDFQRLNLAVLSENDGVFFARSGWASVNGGSAGIATTMWGGDQDTDWDDDDGYPSIVPLGVHLGLAGVAYFGTDVAGYSSFIAPFTTKELFYRWTSAAALTPLMRTHHGSSKCGNWSFDRDEETLAHYRRWASIHTVLYPYFQSLSSEAQEHGWPMIRHPWFVAPETSALWRDQDYVWFVGDALLVAPILSEGSAYRDVELPQGRWWPMFEGNPQDGPSRVSVNAATTELPVFVRGGTALPLLPRTVDSFYGASNAGVTTLADVADEYRVALYPDAEGRVAQTSIGGIQVSATGLGDSLDYATVTLDGSALPVCADDSTGASGPSCYGTTFVRIVQPTAATLSAGAAQITVQGDGQTTLEVAFGGDGWGDWAQATPLTDLNPDIPPPCDP